MVVDRCCQMYVLDFMSSFVLYGIVVGHQYTRYLYGPQAQLVAIVAVGVALQLMMRTMSANPLPHIVQLVAGGPDRLKVGLLDEHVALLRRIIAKHKTKQAEPCLLTISQCSSVASIYNL